MIYFEKLNESFISVNGDEEIIYEISQFLRKEVKNFQFCKSYINNNNSEQEQELEIRRTSRSSRISSSHILNVDTEIINNISEKIFELYCELEDIIIKYIHIAETNRKLRKELLKFLKFITILKILKNNKHLSPIDFGATYPKNLLELIEKNVSQHQKFYNTLIWEK